MERLKGYTTLPFHSTLRVLHLQVESAKSYNNIEPYDSKILNFVIKKVLPRRDLVLGTKCSDCGNIEIVALGMGL